MFRGRAHGARQNGVMRVVGVDACKTGWVGVVLTDGRFARALVRTNLADVLDDSDAGISAVDMPLGLLDKGWRKADEEAQALVGKRRSSVFRVPPKPVWDTPDFAIANQICRERTGYGFSQQTWGLRQKLLEANTLRDAGRFDLYEVHPEVSFRAMAGEALEHGKRSWAGQQDRVRLLRHNGIVVPESFPGDGRVAPDDVLDAAAVAWSAQRIATHAAERVPSASQADSSGREIAIWY